MKRAVVAVGTWMVLAAASARAEPPAASKPAQKAPAAAARPLAGIYQEATRLEGAMELTRTASLYQEILKRADPERDWTLRRSAQQGLLRVGDLRAEFALSKDELQEKLQKAYRDYQPEEFDEWEKRGWILSRLVDGKKGYSILNSTNLGFFETALMARNEGAVKGYRQFAQIFLDESARLDRLRAESPVPQSHVDLVLEMRVAFDAYHTDCQVDPDRIPPYDQQSELFRRFTRSEQQMELTEPLRELARSIVGDEKNAYRKARRLYDWVCDHVKYNFVWRWRDATFTYGCASEEVRQRRIGDCVIQSVFYAALCRSVGVPARVINGPIFPPGMKNDHVWAEVFLPTLGWLPVDVTYSEVAAMVPGLSDAQRRTIRDFFFGRMDRWRLTFERNDLAQDLVPTKRSPRRYVTMFTRPELECGGSAIEKSTLTWECQPE